MKSTVRLSTDLQKFFKPMLIVVANYTYADLWVINGEEGKLVHELRVSKDDELVADKGRIRNPENHADEEHLKHHVKLLVEKITEVMKEDQDTELSLVMPKEVEHLLVEHLPILVQEQIDCTLSMDVTKEPFLKTLERVVKERDGRMQ